MQLVIWLSKKGDGSHNVWLSSNKMRFKYDNKSKKDAVYIHKHCIFKLWYLYSSCSIKKGSERRWALFRGASAWNASQAPLLMDCNSFSYMSHPGENHVITSGLLCAAGFLCSPNCVCWLNDVKAQLKVLRINRWKSGPLTQVNCLFVFNLQTLSQIKWELLFVFCNFLLHNVCLTCWCVWRNKLHLCCTSGISIPTPGMLGAAGN